MRIWLRILVCLLGAPCAARGESVDSPALLAPPLLQDPLATGASATGASNGADSPVDPEPLIELIDPRGPFNAPTELLPPAAIESAAIETAEPLAQDALADLGEPDTSTLLERLRGDNAWARFEPGAWRQMRIVSETTDSEGEVAGRSVTERTDRLVAVDDASYTLRTETIVQLGGRRTPGPVETVRRSLLDDRAWTEGLEAWRGPTTTVSLDSAAEPCEVWTLRRRSAATARVAEEQLFVASGSVPAVLRRELSTPGGLRRETRVTQRDGVTRVGDRLSEAWHVAVSTVKPTGATAQSFTIVARDAPGGVVLESIVERDATGGRSRWAVSELTALGTRVGERLEMHPSAGAAIIETPRRARRWLRRLRRGDTATPPPADTPAE